ncbi:MAG TPA: enhanced serine sensitivity protein SseB C-terminal domain-containing protein [Verrucomicrobiae bacterium]|jgi:hypothetical protein
MTPLNDLERLLATPKFGPQSYPEMFRLLRESELAFLLPYHPEMEGGTIGLKNGDRLPPFVVWESKADGRRIPVFSSIERAQEACKKTGSHEKQYVICEMKGQELFHLISCQEHPIVLNPATTANALFMDMNGVKQIANVPDAQADPAAGKEEGRVQLLAAADYPTDLVNAIFQYLRQRTDVQAAWLATVMNRTEPGTAYIVLVLTNGDQKKLQEGIIIVAGSVLPQKDDTCYVGFVDTNDRQLMAAAAKFPPFFAAPGFKGLGPLEG